MGQKSLLDWCELAYRPVKSVARDIQQMEVVTWLRVKRTPRSANASRFGVRTSFLAFPSVPNIFNGYYVDLD